MNKLLLLLTVCFLPLISSATEFSEGRIKANSLNVRSKPAVRNEVIARLKKGDKVLIEELRGEWLYIVAPAKSKVWLAATSLDAKSEAKEQAKVYAGPGVAFSNYGQIPTGTKIKVLERREDGWVRIEAGDWLRAWVSAKFVSFDKQALLALNKGTVTDIKDKQGAQIAADIEAARLRAAESDKNQQQLEEKEKALQKKLAQVELLTAELKKTLAENKTDQTEKNRVDSAKLQEQISKNQANMEDSKLAMTELQTQIAEAKEKLKALQLKNEQAETGDQLPAVVEKSTLILKKGQVLREGYILAIENNPLVSAAIAVKINEQYYPVAYLRWDYKRIHLLYEKKVRLSGTESNKEGWTRPVLEVDQFELLETDKK